MTCRLHIDDEGNQRDGHRMSDRDAEREAARRFGADGVAWHHPQARRGDRYWCCVGLRKGDCVNDWQIVGKGSSWEAAFADAATKRGK